MERKEDQILVHPSKDIRFALKTAGDFFNVKKEDGTNMSMMQKLREAMDRWLGARKQRNLSTLARLSKVSYSTVRRISQGESTNPDSRHVLALASIVMSSEELVPFAREYLPLLANDRELSIRSEHDELLDLMEDERYIPILILASHSTGTNEAEVTQYFGEESTKRFVQMIDLGILTKVGRENFRLESDIGGSSLETARKWISTMALISRSSNDYIDKSAISHVAFESVNLETALKIYHAGMDYVRTTMSLVQDPNNRGDILVMCGTLFNVLKGVEALK